MQSLQQPTSLKSQHVELSDNGRPQTWPEARTGPAGMRSTDFSTTRMDTHTLLYETPGRPAVTLAARQPVRLRVKHSSVAVRFLMQGQLAELADYVFQVKRAGRFRGQEGNLT